MRFIHISPQKRDATFIEAESVEAGLLLCNLAPGEVDFGNLGGNRSIVVYEYGLIEDSGRGYFSLGHSLYAGEALVFAYDDEGETINVDADDLETIQRYIAFYETIPEVEEAIRIGAVRRPETTVNGAVIWAWNSGDPPPFPKREKT